MTSFGVYRRTGFGATPFRQCHTKLARRGFREGRTAVEVDRNAGGQTRKAARQIGKLGTDLRRHRP